jgi:ferrochelatase
MSERERATAILLTSMGSPSGLEDVEPFLLNVRRGRPVSPGMVKEVRERYRVTSGRTPVLDVFREIARRLEEHLTRISTRPFRAAVGFQHWHPYIRDVYAEFLEQPPSRLVCLCMTPHYSSVVAGQYFEKVEEARTELGGDFHVTYIRSWHRHPLLLEAIADNIVAALERFAPDVRLRVPLLFTAHSLPARLIPVGDPYADEVLGTMEAICDRLGKELPRLAYQGQPRSSEPWLGPDVTSTIEELAREGHRHVLVVPIGFVCDHVDILFDIDLELRRFAEARGMQLERISMLNASLPLVETLASVIQDHLGLEVE